MNKQTLCSCYFVGCTVLYILQFHVIILILEYSRKSYRKLISLSFSERVTEMSTVFRITLRPVLILGQLFGLVNISYTLETTGFIMRTENSTYYGFLELIRMLLLAIFTYVIHIRGMFYIQQFRLIKFWIIIISARLSEIWMIKYEHFFFHTFYTVFRIRILRFSNCGSRPTGGSQTNL